MSVGEAISTSGPKEYRIPSRNYGITAGDAAEILVTAEEIKRNKKLLAAARKELKAKQAALVAAKKSIG